MARHRRFKKDANHNPIVKALEAAGVVAERNGNYTFKTRGQ